MDEQEIARAVAVLGRGGLVAFPTETVYGLGADAGNPAAIAKLYALKGRPAGHPVIVHLWDADEVTRWARDVTACAHRLMNEFWPGPLTLIMRRAANVSDAVTGGQDTVGLRVPAHPVARALLKAFGGGIAAPSANRFGRVSATTAEHVRQEFGDAVDLVIDGGQTEVGIESTILDVTTEQPVLVRPGHISAAAIERCVGVVPLTPEAYAGRASGTLAVHYAPDTLLVIAAGALLHERVAELARTGKRVAVLARQPTAALAAAATWITAPADPAGYAHELYANLRALDRAQCDVILLEQLPASPEWTAINDRIRRAAARAENA